MRPERQILHIDDDPLMTRIIAKRLSEYGYEVSALNDPTQAINELVSSQWRVVLLDIEMPVINGLDLLREIKSYDGGIQVIMLTGTVTLSSALESLRLGAEACFFKPLAEFEPLVATLQRAFDKIDHWWQALEDLSRRRRMDRTPMS